MRVALLAYDRSGPEAFPRDNGFSTGRGGQPPAPVRNSYTQSEVGPGGLLRMAQVIRASSRGRDKALFGLCRTTSENDSLLREKICMPTLPNGLRFAHSYDHLLQAIVRGCVEVGPQREEQHKRNWVCLVVTDADKPIAAPR